MGTRISNSLISLIIIASVGAGSAWADQARLEAVGGGGSVSVKRGGKALQLKKGDELQAGDELSTDDHTAADIRFEDQTLVRVGVNSSYRIDEAAGTTKFLHKLFSGVVRVLVPVKKEAKTEEVKFKMNTPQGTIGVRGTEFTVTIAKGETALRGLSGEVMFGPADADFADKSKFVYVARGFRSAVAHGKQPGKPAQYDIDAYLKEIDGANGPFAGVAKRSNLNVMKRAESAPMVAAATAPAEIKDAPKTPVSVSPAPAKPKKKELSLEEQMLIKVAQGDRKAVEALIKKGADVNYKDESGHSAIHYAIMGDNDLMIQALVELKADVNQPNKKGVTPLMQVAIHGRPKKLADLLIQNGAKTDLKSADGLTAYDIAKGMPADKRDDELVEFLAKFPH